jgi:hypothetical protein
LVAVAVVSEAMVVSLPVEAGLPLAVAELFFEAAVAISMV